MIYQSTNINDYSSRQIHEMIKPFLQENEKYRINYFSGQKELTSSKYIIEKFKELQCQQK